MLEWENKIFGRDFMCGNKDNNAGSTYLKWTLLYVYIEVNAIVFNRMVTYPESETKVCN